MRVDKIRNYVWRASMRGADARLLERNYRAVNVCDTEYSNPGREFSEYRDAVASTGMPWLLEPLSRMDFSGRFESLRLQSGIIVRSNASPHMAVRTSFEIAKSDFDCFCVANIISGDALVEQCGRALAGTRGDLMIFDCSSPLRITQKTAGGSFELLALSIAKAAFSTVQDADHVFGNAVIARDQIPRPLSSCLTALSEMLSTASPDELIALFEASAILLSGAASRLKRREELHEEIGLLSSRYGRELVQFINANLAIASLSPQSAADHLGVSTRYVHRQFALTGTTFGAFVMAKRLECVRRDLISENCSALPIFAIAFRWGFKDLSTFIRAFKKRYGCTPRECRWKG